MVRREIYLEAKDGLAPDPVELLRELRADGVTQVIFGICTTGIHDGDEDRWKRYISLFDEFKPQSVLTARDPRTLRGYVERPCTYPLERLDVPAGSYLPATGETIQGECELLIMSKPYHECILEHIESGDCAEKVRFVEDGLADLESTATKIATFPSPCCLGPILKGTWAALRLLVVHKSDMSVPVEELRSFVERHPKVTCLVVNFKGAGEGAPSRVRCIPLLEEDRFWRRQRSPGPDPVVVVNRSAERPTRIFATWRWDTNPERPRIFREVAAAAADISGLELYRYLEREEYEEKLWGSAAVLCPAGNGEDTHRAWEALSKGAWPILFNSDHTRALRAAFPSLPLLVIDSVKDLESLTVPASPCPFPAVLLREYWRVLIESY
jgi:hypothetical protein